MMDLGGKPGNDITHRAAPSLVVRVKINFNHVNQAVIFLVFLDFTLELFQFCNRKILMCKNKLIIKTFKFTLND